MRTPFLLAVAAAIAAAPATLPAQSRPARGDTMDLATALDLARRANPRLVGARAALAAAGARIAPAGTLPDPTLTVGAMNYTVRGLTRDPAMTMNQVTLMQMVPVNGALGLQRRMARLDSTRTASRRDVVLLAVEQEVRRRYWALYHTDRMLEVIERTVAVLRELSDIATTMYAVGSATQSDVVRSQLAITRMQQEIVALRLERTTLAAALNTVLARSADAALVIPPGPVREGAAAIPGELPPFDSLAALAEAANPEIASAAAMLEGARTGERLARRMVWPDVGLGVAYGQRAGQDDLMSAMVSVTLPVFARSRQLRMRDEARAMRGASEAELAAMRLEVRGMLAAAYAEAQAARRQIAIYWGGLLPQAEASYTAALASYRVGRVDFMTALDAQMALLTYQRDLHRYETMHDIAVAEIDRLTGRSLTVADPSW